MEVKTFICDYEFQSEDDTMLQLTSGDEVEVLHADDLDWWYGKLVNSKDGSSKEGWFPPTYGHLILTTSLLSTLTNHLSSSFPFPPTGTEDLHQSRVLAINEFLNQEEIFIQKLKLFIDKVILPIEYQDTPFKRIILSDASIALSFSLYTKIWNLCSTFTSSLKEVLSSNHSSSATLFSSSSSPNKIQEQELLNFSKISFCFTQFAPSLRLFSQYISENSNVLNSVKSHGKSFNQFLEEIQMPIDTSIESFLTLPVEHYSQYLSCLDRLLYLTSGLLVEKQKEEIDGLNSLRVNCESLGSKLSMIGHNESESFSLQSRSEDRGLQDLREAVDILQTYTNEVDDKLMSESRKHILLAVETQFINHPKIFSPEREYITEGELELVHLDSNAPPKVYHAHLFNDALVLSTRITGFTGKFKFSRAIDLCVVALKPVPSVQITNSFCLESIYSSDESSPSSSSTSPAPTPSSSSSSSSRSYVFNCRSRSGLEWWVKNITLQLTKLSQRHEEKIQQREQKRNSMIKVARRASANWSKQNQPSTSQSSTENIGLLSSTPPPPPPPLSSPMSPRLSNSEQLNQMRLSVQDATTRIDTLQNPNTSIFHQPRVQFILKYLSNEFQFQKKLVDFYQVVIEPLVNTSKGAELQIGLTDLEKDEMSFTMATGAGAGLGIGTTGMGVRRGSDGMLFERRGSYLGVLDSFTGKKQTQQITELISDSNFQIFLFTIENIVYSLIEFLLLFELSLTNVNYQDDSILLGTAVSSSSQAETLFQLFLSYSSSYHTALRVFSSSLLMKFKQLVEEKLAPPPPPLPSPASPASASPAGAGSPGSPAGSDNSSSGIGIGSVSNTTSPLNSFLITILHFPERLKTFLIKLHDMTSVSHADHLPLDHAISHVTKTIQQMHEEYTAHINYDKLLLIQNSFFFTLFQPIESYLKQLVSKQRVFVREGDLIKVCRKTNQEYRFWLFSDALIYGKYFHSTRKYKLHRVIELTSLCNVQSYSMIMRRGGGGGGGGGGGRGGGGGGRERQYAFIINSLEKSFILIATTQEERNSWINDLNLWWNKLMKRMSSNRGNVMSYAAAATATGGQGPAGPGARGNRVSSSEASVSSMTGDDNEPAPVWVPDSMASLCSICKVTINGVTIRRHHCRKCGQMVCSKHSLKRILLPNIHKTQPQRVCDTCSVVIEERNSLRLSSLRLSGSFTAELSATSPTHTEVSGSAVAVCREEEEGEEEGEEEEEKENSRETYLSRRFSMKTFKGFNPTTLPPPKQNTSPPPAPPPRPAMDSPSTMDTKRKAEILSQLLSQKLQVEEEHQEVRQLQRQDQDQDQDQQSHHSENVTTTRHKKIIPAYSIPISFMLTHDSVKSRRSLISTEQTADTTADNEGRKDIELSTFSSRFSMESQRQSQSQDLRPSLRGRPSFLPSDLSYRSLGGAGGTGTGTGEGEIGRGSTKSLNDTGLLHMLTAVMKDDRELLMQSDDDEDNERDSSSDEAEEDEVEAIAMNDVRRFDH